MPVHDHIIGVIESVAYRGAGILRPADGPLVFVHGGVCPGERVEAEIVAEKPRYLEAALIRVLEPSADRAEPCCRVRDADGTEFRVPGCVYDHLDYRAEVALKAAQLRDFLSGALRKAGADPAALDTVWREPYPSPKPLHYRNKIVLHAGRWNGRASLGYAGDDNVSVVDLPECPLACEEIDAELRRLRMSSAFLRSIRRDDDVTFRHTARDGVRYWIGRAPRDTAPLHETVFFGSLEVPPDGFFQVNPKVADAMAHYLANEMRKDPPRAVVDAYCGVGLLGLAIATQCRASAPLVLGMETGRAAVSAARRNARRARVEAEYACCPTAEGLEAAIEETGRGEDVAVVLDPPRDGMEPEVVETLVRLRPARVVCVSCTPDRLARDLARLAAPRAAGGAGYRVESVRLFDMFPRTQHFETVVALRG